MQNPTSHRLHREVRQICRHNSGKKAVRGTIKKLKLENSKIKPESAIKFAGGTLEMHCAYASLTNGVPGNRKILQVSMKS